MKLETERLILRRPRVDDMSDLLRLLSDQSFAATVPEIPRTVEAIREYLEVERSLVEPEKDKCFNLFLERKQDGRLLGLTTIVLRKRSQGEIGCALHTDYRKCGYASEAIHAFMDYAFTELELHRVYAETREDNSAALRVLERLGMNREACFRKMTPAGWADFALFFIERAKGEK